MKDMKIASKIVLALLSIVWAAVVFFLVVYLCREMDWAIAVGTWVTDCWNNVFGSAKSIEGFFNKLGDVLVLVGCGLSFITLVFIILFVKINNEDDEEIEAEREAKKAKKAEVKKAKSLKNKEESEMKKEKKEKKSLFGKVKNAAKKTEEVADAGETLVKETKNSADDFLAALRKGNK